MAKYPPSLSLLERWLDIVPYSIMVGLGLDNCQPSRPISLGLQQHNGALSGHSDGTQGTVERPNRDLCSPTATSPIHRDYLQLRDLIEISVHQLQGSGQTEAHNYQQKCRQSGREKMELVYLKDRMWCIYIHHRVWICYPNVVRRYGRGISATCPLRAEMSHTWPCPEMRKHVVLPLTASLRVVYAKLPGTISPSSPRLLNSPGADV